jgi:hypothetical protein
MHPVHDVDPLLLLATALASKRRPAELAEIMAATDLLHGSIPLDVELAAGLLRLSMQGLIAGEAGGLWLTPAALKIMDCLPRKKAETEERLLALREQLVGYTPGGEFAAISLTTEQLTAAILAHRTFLKAPGRNMLVPKPKPAVERSKRPGQWRKLDTGRRSRG